MNCGKPSCITISNKRGLGAHFVEEAQAAAKTVANNPLAWQMERGDIRRFFMNHFPYKLLYAIEDERVIVIAVAHQHRNPDYWVYRISSP
ncbi:MAG: ParE toxin of type II toxin-antitoxin system, parDE [Candidatus Nitrotoga sp. SPKER]|nr:MAG: ParE toxin of type II toxin-antitoxin system, parDE [Candidatus Nitrotoga sp. SPKER]